MEEHTNSIKRSNLRIMGIEEREEVQAKGIHNMFNKIITEVSRYRKSPGHQTDLTKYNYPITYYH
jgi:hypothetical protein